jgi:hypothetical protein
MEALLTNIESHLPPFWDSKYLDWLGTPVPLIEFIS